RWWRSTAERGGGGRWRRGRGGRTAGRGRRWLDAGPGRPDPPVDRPGGARHAEKSHGPRAEGRGPGREGLVTPSLVALLELQLRATKVGTLLIGAVHARQGRVIVATDPIVVTVDSGAAGGPPALTPLARALVDAAPPPERTDRVALTVVVPTDTVLAGQQL